MEEQHKVRRVTCGTQLTAPGASLVEWATEAARFEVLSDVDGLKPDRRELNDGHSVVTVLDTTSTVVPFGAL